MKWFKYLSTIFFISLALLLFSCAGFFAWCFLGDKDTFVLDFRYNGYSADAGKRAPRLRHPDGGFLLRPEDLPIGASSVYTTIGLYPGEPTLPLIYDPYNSAKHWKIGRKQFHRFHYMQPAEIKVRIKGSAKQELSWRAWQGGSEFQAGTVRDGESIHLGRWPHLNTNPRPKIMMTAVIRFDGSDGCAIFVRTLTPGSRETLDVSLAPGGPEAPPVPTSYNDPSWGIYGRRRMGSRSAPLASVEKPIRFLMPDGREPGTLWWRAKNDDPWQVAENESNPTLIGHYAGSATVGRALPDPLDPREFVDGKADQVAWLQEQCTVIQEKPGGLRTNITFVGGSVQNPSVPGHAFGRLPGTNVIRGTLGRPRSYFKREGLRSVPTKSVPKRSTGIPGLTPPPPPPTLTNVRGVEADGRPATDTIIRVAHIERSWLSLPWSGVDTKSWGQMAGGPGPARFEFDFPSDAPERFFMHRERAPPSVDASDEDLLLLEAFWPTADSTQQELRLSPQPSHWVRGRVAGELMEVWSIHEYPKNPQFHRIRLPFVQDGEDYLVLQPFGEVPPFLHFIFRYPVSSQPDGGHVEARADLKLPPGGKRIVRFDLEPGKPAVRLTLRKRLPVRLSLPNGRPAPGAAMQSQFSFGQRERNRPSRVVVREGVSWIEVEKVRAVEDGIGWVRAGMKNDTVDAWFKVPIDAPELELTLPPLVQVRGRLDPPPGPGDPLPLLGIRPDWPKPWTRINHVDFWGDVVNADGEGRFGFANVREGPVAIVYDGRVVARFEAKGPEMDIVVNREQALEK